ncbi:MAG: hypothetical protein KMY53_20225 [Desulfarculus sp.]|nr:hypothetical protein [Pseudomonadota bacterium]MBV1717734.1 hypothetical protein [Desulfarculus sp.]MBU4576742.1 hypothetical protein [Pseudomonadota bacterium]MBU4596731.1 hypothetical protein [Pseudomonadota bacterium]MBV1740500.1 hypothetical protein [Desulfarculus sp.]
MKRLLLVIAAACLILGAPAISLADQASQLLQETIKIWQDGKPKEALQQVDQAVQLIWNKVPLYVQKAVLTEAKAQSYGIYAPRADNVYEAKKATILLYVEPVGYRITKAPDDFYTFGFTADLAIMDTKENILVGKENFMSVNFKSRTFNREIFLNITVNIGGMPPGDYLLGLRIKDTSGQSTPLRVPVTFK